MKPKTVILLGKVTAFLMAIGLAYYVAMPFSPTDIIRNFVVAVCIVFTCFMLVPVGFLWVGAKLHARSQKCDYKPSNLERI